MNPFPRIHSLGTVNIIHHQEFFYRLHPFRTDFVGDSGVGKSIITDLLQLILIGSSEYCSSTQGKDDRPFQSLALKTNNNTDFGYAYINVEIASGQYLVLGTYIAGNQNQTQAFIIQQSLDFDADTLEPLGQPIAVDAFERDGKWLPIDELDQYFNDKKDLGFKKFRRFSEYHQMLHTNRLLPLDVTTTHTLKDYAKILQTFARKNINIKDGVDLQDFLFGRHWRMHFKNKSEQVVSSMKDDISTFRTNREQLDKIELKQKALKELFDLKSKLEKAKKIWQWLQYHYISHQKQETASSIQDLLKKYFQSRRMLEVLREMKDKKVEELTIDIPILEDRKQIRSKEADQLKKSVNNIEAISELMAAKELASADAVREFHRKFNDDRVLYSILQRGKILLENQKLTIAFNSLDHAKGLSDITKRLQTEIASQQQELNMKEALWACNDIENPNSLVYWALNNRPKLTPEQESMVLYFQQQSVQTLRPDEAEPGNRYIPAPAVAIAATIQKSGNGFWADFGGVHSFFNYKDEDKRLFDGKDEETIKVLFQADRDVLQQTIQTLKMQIETQGKLSTFLVEVQEPRKFLEAWSQREVLNYRESDLNDEVLNWTESQLNTALNDYIDKDQTLTLHRNAEEERDDLISQLGAKKSLKKLLGTFTITHPGTVDTFLAVLKAKFGMEVQEEEEPEFEEDIYYAHFKELHSRAERGIKVKQEVVRLYELLGETEIALTELNLENESDFEQCLPVEYSKETLAVAKTEFDTCDRKYDGAYRALIADPNILANDRSRLEQTKDFKTLVRHVLPAIFQKIDFNEAEVWQKITGYMDDILYKNAEINKNKLVKVRDLMQELHHEIGRQTNILREVSNMLNRREAEISGGLKASLKTESNSRIDVQWIAQFLYEMPAINEGLWSDSIQTYLSEREQRQKMSIDDLIIDEYKRYTDHPLPNITIDDLLSPFSYYTLNYKIRTASGISNSGSTGQTYTALALLCIAKLSMMKKDQEHQSDGLRFMSIDEAAGIGSNMDMLEKIAKKYGYQILSLSIPLHRIKEGEQYIYRLYKDTEKEFINKHPIAIFSNKA